MSDFLEIISSEGLHNVERLITLLSEAAAKVKEIDGLMKGKSPSGLDNGVRMMIGLLKEQETNAKKLQLAMEKTHQLQLKLEIIKERGLAREKSGQQQVQAITLDGIKKEQDAINRKYELINKLQAKQAELARVGKGVPIKTNDLAGLQGAKEAVALQEKLGARMVQIQDLIAIRAAELNAKRKEYARQEQEAQDRLDAEDIKKDNDALKRLQKRREAEIAIEKAREKAMDDFNAKEAAADARKLKQAQSTPGTPEFKQNFIDKSNSAEQARQIKLEALANGELGRSFDQLNAKRQLAADKLRNLIAAEGSSNREIRQAQREFDALDKKVRQANTAIGNIANSSKNFSVSLLSNIRGLAGAFGIGSAAYIIADTARSIYENTKAIQSMDLALKMVSGTQEKFASNQAFLTRVTEQWGVEIKSGTKNFTDFYASAKGLLSDTQIKDVFESISKSAAIMGRSVEQQEQTFLALEQMMSKGTIQAEELKRQLGNALPGSIRAAAMAYMELHPEITNVQVAEKNLLRDMKQGLIDSATYVPLIAKQFEKLYGIERLNQVNTIAAAQNRLKNSWIELVRTMNESETGGLTIFFSALMNGINMAIKGLAYLNSSMSFLMNKAEAEFTEKGRKDLSRTLDKRKLEIDKAIAKKQEEYKKAGKDPKLVTEEMVMKENPNLKPYKFSKEQLDKSSEASAKKIEFLEKEVEAQEKLVYAEAKRLNKDPEYWVKEITSMNMVTTDVEQKHQDMVNKLESLRESLGWEKGRKGLVDDLRNPPPKAELGGEEGKFSAPPVMRDIKKLDLDKERIVATYNAEIAALENLRETFRSVMEDESKTYDERLAANEKFHDTNIQLLQKETEKEAALATQKAKELMEKIEKIKADNEEKIADNVRRRARAMSKGKPVGEPYDANAERIKSDEDYAKAKKQIEDNLKDDLEAARLHGEMKYKQDLQEELAYVAKIENEKADLVRGTAMLEHQIAKRRLQRDIDNPRSTLNTKNTAFEEIRKMELAQLDVQKKLDILHSNGSQEQLDNINAKYKNLRHEIESMKSPLQEAKEATDQWMISLTGEFFSNSGFQSLFRMLNEELVGFGENWQATFSMIAEVGQEAMNFVAASIQDNTAAQIAQLDKDKEIALAFAADTEDARAEIQRQYDERRAEIERQNFEKRKKLAVANVMIDGAQAIVGAWVRPGWPWAIGLSALIAGLMAAQIGVINGQQVESFWKGTDNAPEGWARTDEQGAELHTDKHGNIKDFGSSRGARFKYLSAGDKIFTASKTKDILQGAMFDSQLNSILATNAINPIIVQSNGWNSEEFNKGIDRLADKIGSKPSFLMSVDRRGERIYREEKGRRTELMNNRLNIRTFDV